MEVSILENELEITRQKLELANKELQAKEALVTQMEETIEILKWRVELQESMISQIKDIADRLLEKVDNSEAPLLGKKDIMTIFDKESDFALRFLRFAKSIGCGIQVGKEYYIKREEFEKVLSTYQGRKLEI